MSREWSDTHPALDHDVDTNHRYSRSSRGSLSAGGNILLTIHYPTHIHLMSGNEGQEGGGRGTGGGGTSELADEEVH